MLGQKRENVKQKQTAKQENEDALQIAAKMEDFPKVFQDRYLLNQGAPPRSIICT